MTVNPDRVLKTLAAIEAGDSKTVRLMLKGGVPANHMVAGTSEADRRSLAHYAANRGQLEIFELLIAAGADIDALEAFSWRPPSSMLECACSARPPSLEIVQKILREGRPTQEQLNHSLLAASYGHASSVEALLQAGADPNYSDPKLDTPLIVALLSDNEDIAIRLIEAGADTTGSIRNKDRAAFWKKSVQDVATLKGMKRVSALLGVSSQQTVAKDKAQRTRKPKTIDECWATIDDWISRNMPDVRLPPAFDFSQATDTHELLQAPAAQQIRMSLSCHDGTGDFAIVDVPGDASYELLSVNTSLEVRDMQRALLESEWNMSKSEWWSDSWWPIGDNGGGDLLVVDCSQSKTAGQVLQFSHETQRATRFKKSVLDLLQSIAVDLEWRN